MAMTIIKVTQLTGCSRESWSDAAGRAVYEAMRLLQPIINADAVKSMANGALTRLDEYQVTVSVAFIVEAPGLVGIPASAPTVFEREISIV